MKNVFNKFKKYLYLVLVLFGLAILLSVIYLLANVSFDIISTILLILTLVFAFLVGYLYSLNNHDKGIISGLKIGLIIIVIMFIISFLIKVPFKPSRLIYYLIIILSSIFGSIVSKNIKK